MSVVNRMLQDIDRRSGAAALDARGASPDIRSVPLPAPRGRRNAWLAGGAALLIALAVFAATWGEGRLWRSDPVAVAHRPAVTTPPPAVAPSPVATKTLVEAPANSGSAPEPASSGTPDEARSVAGPTPAPPAAARAPIDSFRLSLYLSSLPASPPPGKAVASVSRTATLTMPTPTASTPAPSTAAAPTVTTTMQAAPTAATPAAATPTPTSSTTTRTVSAVRHVAAAETVASARQLWSEGSREGALATLRDALAAAEASRDTQAVRLLARELAGLELAGNRPQATLDLLRRHADLYAEDADALALRGNAQQRLGMHSEAAESYLAALRLRPTEGKWMVGAAISLAADGRKEEAQSWVDRARDRGAITPPIAAYLQQLGFSARP